MSNSPVIKKGKVYQRFNLKEMFGVDVSQTPELRKAVAQAVIDKIRARTEDGKAIGGKRSLYAPYSDEYSQSIEFKAAGKKKNKVNMSLHGDMMNLLDVTEETANTFTVGWSDEKENLKAYNHNAGDTVKKRDFFGLNKTEIKEIVSQFKPDVKDAVKTLKKEGRDAYTEKAMALLDKLEGVDGGDE